MYRPNFPPGWSPTQPSGFGWRVTGGSGPRFTDWNHHSQPVSGQVGLTSPRFTQPVPEPQRRDPGVRPAHRATPSSRGPFRGPCPPPPVISFRDRKDPDQAQVQGFPELPETKPDVNSLVVKPPEFALNARGQLATKPFENYGRSNDWNTNRSHFSDRLSPFHRQETREKRGDYVGHSGPDSTHREGYFGGGKFKNRTERKRERQERQKSLKAAAKSQEEKFGFLVQQASPCKDELFITPFTKGSGGEEIVAAMRLLVAEKFALSGIIWQYIDDETGVIELSFRSRSFFVFFTASNFITFKDGRQISFRRFSQETKEPLKRYHPVGKSVRFFAEGVDSPYFLFGAFAVWPMSLDSPPEAGESLKETLHQSIAEFNLSANKTKFVKADLPAFPPLDGSPNDAAKIFLILDDDFGVIKIIETFFETTTSRLCFFHKSQLLCKNGQPADQDAPGTSLRQAVQMGQMVRLSARLVPGTEPGTTCLQAVHVVLFGKPPAHSKLPKPVKLDDGWHYLSTKLGDNLDYLLKTFIEAHKKFPGENGFHPGSRMNSSKQIPSSPSLPLKPMTSRRTGAPMSFTNQEAVVVRSIGKAVVVRTIINSIPRLCLIQREQLRESSDVNPLKLEDKLLIDAVLVDESKPVQYLARLSEDDPSTEVSSGMEQPLDLDCIKFYHQHSSLEPLPSHLVADLAKVHLILTESYGVLKSGPALIMFNSCDVWTGPGSTLNSDEVSLGDFFRQDSEILVNAALINPDSKFQFLATSVWLKKDMDPKDPCLASLEINEIEPEKLEHYQKVVEIFKEMPMMKSKSPKFPETIFDASVTVSAKPQFDTCLATNGDKSCLVALTDKDLDVSMGANLKVDMVLINSSRKVQYLAVAVRRAQQPDECEVDEATKSQDLHIRKDNLELYHSTDFETAEPGLSSKLPASLKAARGIISYRSACSNAGIITGPNGVLVYYLKVDVWERRDKPAKDIENQLVKWNKLNPDERRKTNTTFVVGSVVYFNAVTPMSEQDVGSKIPYLATAVWTEGSMEWVRQYQVSEPPEIPQQSIKPCTWTQLRSVNINPHLKFPNFPGVGMIEMLDSKSSEPKGPKLPRPVPAVLHDLVRVDGFITQRSEAGHGGRIVGPNGEFIYFESNAILDLIEFKWIPFNSVSTSRRKKVSRRLQLGKPVHFNAKLIPGTTHDGDPFTHLATHVICEKSMTKAKELGIEIPDLDEVTLSDDSLDKFWTINRDPGLEFPKLSFWLEKAKRKAEDSDLSAKRRRIDDSLDAAEFGADPSADGPGLPHDLQDGLDSKQVETCSELIKDERVEDDDQNSQTELDN